MRGLLESSLRFPGHFGMENKRIHFGSLPKEKIKAVHALDFQIKNKEPLSSRLIKLLIESK